MYQSLMFARRGAFVAQMPSAVVAVAGRAGRVELLALAPDCRRTRGVGTRVGQRADVGDDVADRGVVGEHRCERHHLLAVGVVLVRAAHARA